MSVKHIKEDLNKWRDETRSDIQSGREGEKLSEDSHVQKSIIREKREKREKCLRKHESEKCRKHITKLPIPLP